MSEYLAELPSERRAELSVVRTLIKKHLPNGYSETVQYGMISYVVPLKLFPDGYLNQKEVPLPFVSLAAQKNYFALYLMNVYGNPELERWFRAAYAKSGKKLDMGRSCVRFKKAGELALDVVGEAIARTSVKDYIERYVAARGNKGPPSKNAPASRGRATARARPSRPKRH